MKEKNFQNNINTKSLDELTVELNKIIENLEKEKNLVNSSIDSEVILF